VTLPDEPGVWRVAALAFERMMVRLTLVPDRAGLLVPRAADAGRNLAQDDRVHGPTTLAVIDLPGLGDAAETMARVAVAARRFWPAVTVAHRSWRSAGRRCPP
jgi:hypothetical protein